MELLDALGAFVARYTDFAIDFGIDAVAIFVMAYVLYFRRHWRSDLLLSYVTLNLGIFTVMSILSVVRVDIAVGFGLFAILSIIRLRSSAVTQQEVAYYFVALVMGLVNGINLGDRWLLVLMNVLLLAAMFVVDSRRLRERSRRVEVSLKKLYTSDAELVADLEQRLGGRVMYHEVTQIDYVHSHTSVDVRYRPGTGVAVPQPVELAVPAATAVPPTAVPPTAVPLTAVSESVEDTQVMPAVSRPADLVLASSPSGPRDNGAARPE
jgi:hypothetical protein